MSYQEPSVRVRQQFTAPPSNIPNPLLPAVCLAPAYEVIELYEKSILNTKAKYVDSLGQSYRNGFRLLLGETDFPGGHVTKTTGGTTNVKAGQVDILEEEIRAFVKYGTVRELAEYDAASKVSVYKGFHTAMHYAKRPYVLGSVDVAGGGFALAGSFLALSVDQIGGVYPAYLPSTLEGKDTVVTFRTGSESGGTLSAEDIVDQINAELPDVAQLVEDGAAVYIALVSPSWGANARVIVRDTGASSVLGFHAFGSGDLYALGSGFRMRDDGNGDQESPLLELYRGTSRVVGTSITAGAVIESDLTDPDSYEAGSFPIDDVTFVSTKKIRVGDEIVADGVSVGLVHTAQNKQLTLGTAPIAAANDAITKQSLGLQTHPTTPFAPRYLYVVARNLLEGGDPGSTAATLTSNNASSSVWTDPKPAQVTGANAPTFPLAFGAGKTFLYNVKQDGVVKDVRTHTISGTAASIGDLVTALNTGSASGISVSPPLSLYEEIYAGSSGGNVVFATGADSGNQKTGRDQALFLGAGSANILFDDGSPNAATIEEDQTYQGLGHYSLTRTKGDGGLATHDNALISGVDAVLNVVAVKKARITAIENNGAPLVLDVKIEGDFTGGSTPFTGTADLEGLDNLATALNGESQSSTSGTVKIAAVDGDDELEDELLSLHTDLAKWHFQGPREYIEIDGTETGTFTVGETVTQATTLATGVVLARTAAVTTLLQIRVTEGSAFNLTATITGASSGATLTGAPMTARKRLALSCRQEGSSNLVKVNNFDGSNLLSQTFGFADGSTVRGVGIRIGGPFFLHIDQNPDPVLLYPEAQSVQWNVLGENDYIFLEDIVDRLNELVYDGFASIDDASGAGNSKLALLNFRKGLSSEIKIDPRGDGGGNAGYVEIWCGTGSPGLSTAEMGLTFDADSAEADQSTGRGALSNGLGRGQPDFAVIAENPAQIEIQSQIIRDPVTGYPLGQVLGEIYLTYRGLRKDITAAVRDLGFDEMVSVTDATLLEADFGPLNAKNPFGLALRLALDVAAGVPVYGLGIDEVDADNPDGTLLAWNRALEFLETPRAYALAPITTERRILALVSAHISKMSDGASQGERIMYCHTPLPTEKPATILGGGLDANRGVSSVVVSLEESVIPALQQNGVSNPASIPYTSQVYLELADTPYRWSVSAVTPNGAGCLVTVRTTFGSSENSDAFYTTQALPSSIVNLDWALYKRGAALTTKDEVAEAAAEQGRRFGYRRIRHLVAKDMVINLTGTDDDVSPKYACAVYAAMASVMPANRSFTNVPVPGIVKIRGTNDTFSVAQLNIIAGGGNFILVQQNRVPMCRHQLTTDMTSADTQEDSITRQVDRVGYRYRDAIQPHLGGDNDVSPDLLDYLAIVLNGIKEAILKERTVRHIEVIDLSVNPDNPRSILLSLGIGVRYPFNEMGITLVI